MHYTKNQINNIKKLEKEMSGKYLTEELLGKFLKVIYPDNEWLHDQRFKLPNNENIKFNFRPDYCCHELKMCVEFDGHDHYMKANIIQADNNKDAILTELDYKIIRIPYFIQLDTASIIYFFGLTIPFDYGFPHGFISKNVIFPANYCEQGIWKFKDIITSLSLHEETYNIFEEIRNSIIDKIESNLLKLPTEKAVLNVVPSTLTFALNLKKYNHDSVSNQNIVKSNLSTSWNCVLLENSQTMREQANIFDIEYTYNSKGNISGYSFSKLFPQHTVRYTLLIEEEPNEEDTAIIFIYENDELLYQEHVEASSVSIFSITDLISSYL